jgi:hypothetical protein
MTNDTIVLLNSSTMVICVGCGVSPARSGLQSNTRRYCPFHPSSRGSERISSNRILWWRVHFIIVYLNLWVSKKSISWISIYYTLDTIDFRREWQEDRPRSQFCIVTIALWGRFRIRFLGNRNATFGYSNICFGTNSQALHGHYSNVTSNLSQTQTTIETFPPFDPMWPRAKLYEEDNAVTTF